MTHARTPAGGKRSRRSSREGERSAREGGRAARARAPAHAGAGVDGDVAPQEDVEAPRDGGEHHEVDELGWAEDEWQETAGDQDGYGSQDGYFPENLGNAAQNRQRLQHQWARNATFDIESGLWASPFFGAFAALRFFIFGLLGQLLLIICVVFTDDGLAVCWIHATNVQHILWWIYLMSWRSFRDGLFLPWQLLPLAPDFRAGGNR